MKKLLLTKILVIVSLFLVAQTDVLPPQLVLPTNGDDDQLPDTELDWYASSGIGEVSYEVSIDTSADFTDPMIYSVDVTSLKTSELLFGTVYYWRVRAIDNVGTSDWSETFSFSTFDQVGLTKPTNGNTTVTPRAQLIWSNKKGPLFISGLSHYDYRLSVDTFNTIYTSGSVPFSSFPEDTLAFYAWVNQLDFGTTFQWQVRARHAKDESEWSDPFSFTTLNAVTLVSPVDEATNQDLEITLEWDEMTGAFEYIYEFCTDPNFTLPCMAISETNTANPQGVMFGATYYWRVKALHTTDTSDWSPTWSFEAINTVIQVSPANASYVDDIFPTLEWQPIAGVSGFQIMFDESESFNMDPMEFSTEGTESSYDILTALTYDKTYFWKLRAFENGDTTEWSATWSFTVGVNGVGEIIDQNDLQIYPNPAQDVIFIKALTSEVGNAELTISNLLGQTVISQPLKLDHPNAKEIIMVNGLENGLYILQVKAGAASYSKKIIIER